MYKVSVFGITTMNPPVEQIYPNKDFLKDTEAGRWTI
jgi:hypothetical protein